MTAVNASLHELAVKLQPWVGYVSSTPDGDGQIIHIKESEDMTVGSVSSYAGLLETDIFGNSIEVLLGPAESNTPTLSTIESGSNEGVTAPFDLLDSSSGQDLTLSPQTFTNSTEAFINDNSNSLGVQMENEAVSTTTEEKKPPPSAVVSGGATATGEAAKLTVKRPRPKAASPNRQGPQQCQVCGKVFGNASALAKHKLTHSDERKYVCNMCGKAFKRQDHLNGHMLTHRNKKPYECKADGCGKSYCDARSLRRHTENHHSTPSSTSSSGSSSSSSSSSTTMSPAQGAASGDAASPHGSSCIQYAPPPPSASSTTTTSASSTTGEATSSANQQSGSGGKSQLQQLLATDPNKNGNLGDNDGFTQLQKVLIDQIMDQQSPPIVKSPSKPPSKSSNKSSSIKMQRAWNTTGTSTKTTTTTTSTPTGAASSPKVSTTTPSSPANPNPKGEMKPVECNLCHRKFKNIPALNGHMRLHGGYFKKDAENKNKCEKKDSNGPPLQTASSNVRALIGEKIINKRITTASTPAPAEDASVPSSTAPPLFPLHGEPSSFVVPAPPQHSTEKVRRHSDAEAFTAPKSSTQQEAEALADLILKPEKVKRTSSDPGRHQQIIRFQTSPADSFTLYQSGDEYGEDVFGQEQMLLQGVDAQQLASIHFQADSLLRDQNEQQLLESYPNLQEVEQSSGYQSGPVNQDLQAVLDSPLPESLAEFSTYHATNMSPNYQTQSPVQYVNSPHTSLAAQSPLQSPLITHDSPGFAYPTPPASHEGQSPCFTQNTILPMVSPKQDYSQMTTMEEPPQASSPLSAAFFTSTMSSSAAVEEALEEVLPGETINNDDIYPLSQSPNPQSPLSIGLTPVPSPLSNMAQSSAPSPHPNGGTFQQNSATSFSQFSLQQQMMPNSDDPLLSSSPKDFQAKRQFEFSGTPLKLVELNTGNFTRILIDSNGEFKILQPVVGKNIYFSGTTLLTTTPIAQQEVKDPKLMKTVQYTFPTIPLPNRPSKISPTNGLDVKLEDSGKGTFLSPTTVPASSPVRQSRKRPRTEPLQLPVRYQSKLRSTRSKPQGSAPYTPQPLLNPQRPGSGLYCTLRKSPSDPDDFPSNPSWSNESIPESDSTPHVNIGPQFQCNVASSVSSRRCRIPPASCHEDLLWDPGIAGCLTEAEVDMYLDFACCAAVPGGGRNAELALHLLNMCGGNIHEAILKLMQPAPSLPKDHHLMNYQYNDNEKWSAQEIDKFHQSLLRHNKDFFVIAQEVGTKSAKQCVQFYYMWKKVCVDDYKRFKDERRLAKKIEELEPFPDAKLLGIIDNGSPMTIGDHRHFICEYSDCSASFNSKAALNGHIRIHGGTASRGSPTPSTVDRRQPPVTSSTACHSDPADDYPCKICGKVFTKIKSRSAHMKSHRPPDADSSKKKEKDQVSSSTLDVPVQSPYGTTCP